MKPKREIQKDKADYLLECEKKVNYEPQINIYVHITYESKFDCCIQQLNSNKATLENKLFQTQGMDMNLTICTRKTPPHMNSQFCGEGRSWGILISLHDFYQILYGLQ